MQLLLFRAQRTRCTNYVYVQCVCKKSGSEGLDCVVVSACAFKVVMAFEKKKNCSCCDAPVEPP